MKILKILGIAAGVHALALVLLLSSPGCSSSKAQTADAVVASPAPGISDAPTPPPATITVPSPDSATIRYSPTRPGTAVAAALEAPPVSDVTPATTYAVVSGDSISAVAKRFHLTKSELASANHLRSSSTLHVGQRLIIPSKAASAPAAPESPAQRAAEPQAAPPAASGDTVRHTVKPGETLGAIARHYGVRQGDIAVANNITDPKRIRPGQELVIPAKGSAGARPARAAAAEPQQAKAPPASEDLDAGLKPASGDVPTVKVDDGAQQPKNP